MFLVNIGIALFKISDSALLQLRWIEGTNAMRRLYILQIPKW